MPLIVCFVGLGREFTDECDKRAARALNDGSAILPDSVLVCPTRTERIALILVKVVQPESCVKRLPKDVDGPADFENAFQCGSCRDVVSSLPALRRCLGESHQESGHGVRHHDKNTTEAGNQALVPNV